MVCGRVIASLVVAVSCAAATPVGSLPQPKLSLYQARTLVTGTDMRSRPAGLHACLVDVLTKVSGDPALIGDARVRAMDAAPLVRDFDYVDRMGGIPHHDEQGSSDRPYYLTVRFDPARVASALAGLGEAPWTAPRPAIVPEVTVDAANEEFALTADTARAANMRAALDDAADRYAMTLEWPGMAASANAVRVTGRLVWSDGEHGWVAEWRSAAGGAERRWGVRGVSFDEAFRVLVRGAMGIAAGHGLSDTSP